MKKLVNLVTLVTNTEDCVVLKVNENAAMDLVCLGCFDGNEEMFRLTKGPDVTCTVWTKGGGTCSWSWGERGHTLVSDKVEQMGILIKECIQLGFDILCEAPKDKILEDMKRGPGAIKEIIVWSRDHYKTDWGCRVGDVFVKSFKSKEEATNYFLSNGYVVKMDPRKRVTAVGYECYEGVVEKVR